MDRKNVSKVLNNMNEHKLTRRRVMRAAAAAGMSSAAVLTMTQEDVKASDSDQVTIPFTISGDVKKQIDADLLDWYYRARDATKQITKAHFEKEGVNRIGTRGGGSKDNPHVIVILDDRNGKADERRGEIPEEINDVRVELETYDEVEDERYNGDICNKTETWNDKDNFPGGQPINAAYPGGRGTNSSRILSSDYDWVGWTSAAHVQNGCEPGDAVYYNYADAFYKIGEVTKVDQFRDIIFIEEAPDIIASALNLKPSHDEGVKIKGTVTEEGFVTVNNQDQPHAIYGSSSCFVDMKIKSWNNTYDSDYKCKNTAYDQMFSTINNVFQNETEEGDSGALYFVEDPNNSGNYYAMGNHSGKDRTDTLSVSNYGVQGFTIANIYDRYWK